MPKTLEPDWKKLRQLAQIAEQEKASMTPKRYQELIEQATAASRGFPMLVEFLALYAPEAGNARKSA